MVNYQNHLSVAILSLFNKMRYWFNCEILARDLYPLISLNLGHVLQDENSTGKVVNLSKEKVDEHHERNSMV